jgi:eukaryotic-like serine/threonine-protein kinase
MPLSAGSRLGAYEIVAPIGSGGMGEVYRARDAKLNRDVAIKVLPDRLSKDASALSRFEREAQAVAALSHPNIMAIHDFGSEQGVVYAVTELLEGATLRDRLNDGALNPRKAIEYGVQIVRGIAAAHERGIVHRDLKPENIFVTKDGVVKILDFGLAKSADAANPAETKLAETTPGTVLGTVGYMSPEQVRGQNVDQRTDIFSFGAILYEMLTGRRAFKGDSQVETMNAILKEDPPEFSEVNPGLPSSFDRIIRRCIEKQPAERFHSAHDLAISLEALSGGANASTSSTNAAALAAMAAPARRFKTLPVAAAVLLVGAAAFFAGRLMFRPPIATAPEYQRLTYRRGPVLSLAIAPDGATIVYSARWDGTPKQLYSTRPGSPESLALPYVKADIVSISSTGELAIVSNRKAIRAYSQPGTLARAPLSGGAARDLLENVQDADWLPDGTNLVVTHVVDGRYHLEFPIGKSVYETGGWLSHPRVSPDGKLVAFLDHPLMGDDRGFLAVVDASGKVRRLSGEYSSTQGLAWLRSGKEVWFTGADKGSGRGLQAATLDGTVRSVIRVPSNLLLGGISANGDVLLSSDSARRGIVGLAPGESTERDLSWLDWSQPIALSSDGKFVLTTEEGDGGGNEYAVYLRKTDGSPAVRLGPGEALALSPDGKWVIAQPQTPGPSQLVLLPTGAGTARPLTHDDITHLTAAFMPDGKRFIFTGFQPGKPPRTWIQDLGGGAPKPVTPDGVQSTLITPDGTKLWSKGDGGVRRLYPVDGSAPEVVKFVEAADGMLGFAADGHSVFVARTGDGGTAQISRLDLTNGTRTPIRVITPLRESLGNGGIGSILITPDGKSYVYGYGVTVSDLYLVKGLK